MYACIVPYRIICLIFVPYYFLKIYVYYFQLGVLECVHVCVCTSAAYACRGQRYHIPGASFPDSYEPSDVGWGYYEQNLSPLYQQNVPLATKSSLPILRYFFFKENISDSDRQAFCTMPSLFIIVAYFFSWLICFSEMHKNIITRPGTEISCATLGLTPLDLMAAGVIFMSSVLSVFLFPVSHHV